MELGDRLAEISGHISRGSYETALRESGVAVEHILREWLRRDLFSLDVKHRQSVLAAEQETGKGQRGIEDFTMGQLVGVIRQSAFFDAWGKAFDTDVKRLKLINLDALNDLRNEVMHKGQEATRSDAEFLFHCLKQIGETFTGGAILIDVPDETPEPLEPDGPDALSRDVVNRHAVVIGISHYNDPSIPDLKYAASDARAVSEALIDLGRFKEEYVRLLVDEDANLTNIRIALDDLRKADPDNLILIYFAGHGSPDIAGAAGGDDSLTWKYLVPHDAQTTHLSVTAFPMDDLATSLKRTVAGQAVLLFDSCYSGAGERSISSVGARGVVSDSMLEELADESCVILAASDASQMAFEGEAFEHGLFTHFLLEGMGGAALKPDRDLIDVYDLYDYVAERTPVEAAKLGGHQDPVLKGARDLMVPLSYAGNECPSADEVAETEARYPFSRARSLMKEGSFSEALQLLEEHILEAGTGSGEAYALVGDCCLGIGQEKGALEAYRQSIEANPALADGHVGSGNVLLGMGRYDESLDCYRYASEIDDSHTQHFFRVQQQLDQKMSENPDDPELCLSLARAYGLQEKATGASNYLLRAIEMWPMDDLPTLSADVSRSFAFLSLRNDDRYERISAALDTRRIAYRTLSEGLSSARKALEAGDLLAADGHLATCRQIQAESSDIDAISTQVEADRSVVQDLLRDARDARTHSNYTSSIDLIEQAARLDVSDPRITAFLEEVVGERDREHAIAELVQKGITLEAQGNHEEAVQVYVQALNLAPGRETTVAAKERAQAEATSTRRYAELLGQAEGLRQEKRWKEGLECVSRAIAEFPGRPELDTLRETFYGNVCSANLQAFARGPLIGQLAQVSLNVGALVSRETVENHLNQAGCLPIDLDGAHNAVGERFLRLVRQRTASLADQAWGAIKSEQLEVAGRLVKEILALDRGAPELADLRKGLEIRAGQARDRKRLAAECGMHLGRGEWKQARELIDAHRDLIEGRPQFDRLYRTAHKQMQHGRLLRRALEVASRLQEDGKLDDALYGISEAFETIMAQKVLRDRALVSEAEALVDQIAREVLDRDRSKGASIGEGELLVPTGWFIYGDHFARQAERGKTWSHVFLPGYRFARYPVTNREYRAFLDYVLTGKDHTGCHPDEPVAKDHAPLGWGEVSPADDEKPVVGVDWFDAYAFAAWSGRRLPTEAEWEQVAFWDSASKKKNRFPTGDAFDFGRCNCAEHGPASTVPVGQSRETDSFYGAGDLLGNTWEWVTDWYREERVPRKPWDRNPLGPPISDTKVILGGGWSDSRAELGLGCRSRAYLLYRSNSVGFRCACSLNR